MRIIKESGEIENFDEGKLINSLLKARATNELVEEIVAHIKTELKEGMGTDQIYKHASFLLKKKSRKVEISYSLKRAVLDLGPSGFPFEKFIGEILREKGFKVINNLLIKGRCAEHELDVLAYNENKLITAEAKFHNSLGVKSDLKTALYVKAKFDDFVVTSCTPSKSDQLSAVYFHYLDTLVKPCNIPVYHLFPILLKNFRHRDDLQAELAKDGIQTGIHYPLPLHLQPAFSNLNHKKGDFPNAEEFAKKILSIPIYPELKEEDQEYIINSINDFFKLS